MHVPLLARTYSYFGLFHDEGHRRPCSGDNHKRMYAEGGTLLSEQIGLVESYLLVLKVTPLLVTRN
jgi:hypothetical protein